MDNGCLQIKFESLQPVNGSLPRLFSGAVIRTASERDSDCQILKFVSGTWDRNCSTGLARGMKKDVTTTSSGASLRTVQFEASKHLIEAVKVTRVNRGVHENSFKSQIQCQLYFQQKKEFTKLESSDVRNFLLNI